MSGLELMAPSALIALLPLGALIVLLYLLKLRRREVTVPSVFLWRRSVEDVQANAPLQKLRVNLLLLLQLLALAALVLGLAAPFVMARRTPGQTVVLVLDASASMRATDVTGSRFDEAVRQARQIASALTAGDEVALIVCGARPRVAVPLGADRRRVLRALDTLQPSDCPTNLRDGLLLGAGLTARRTDASVFVIGDGGATEFPELPSAAQVRFVAVGARSDNVAILAFEAALPPGSEHSQLFLRLRNFGAGARQCDLAVYHEDEVLDARRVEIAGESERVETWEADLPEPGLLRAELAVDDDLAADNVAWTPATPPAANTVLVVGPENLFLEQALVVQPGLQVFRADTLTAAQAEAAYAQYDLVIFDRAAMLAPPTRGGVLTIDAGGWPALAEPGAAVDQPRIGAWEEDHPALRHVNLAAAGIATAHALTPGPEAQVLARAGDAPMVVALEREGLRGLALGWNLLDSDLPLRVGFPVLLSNAVSWLTEPGRAGDARVVRTGQTVRVPVAPEATVAEVLRPDGRRERVEAIGGEVVFASADRVGVYRLSAGERTWRWAADLRDAAESDLTPRTELTVGGRATVAEAEALRREQHFWPWLAALALVALLAEWLLYHRRY